MHVIIAGMRAAWLCIFALALACADDDSSATTTDGSTTMSATTMPATGMTSPATSSGSSGATGATSATSSGDSTDAGTSSTTGGATVTCEDCDPLTEFCFHSIVDGPTEISCRPIPTRCEASPDCACIEPLECPKSVQSCDDTADLVDLQCVEG